MEPRKFDQKKLEELRKLEEFDFYHFRDEESWLDRLLRYYDQLLTSLSNFFSEKLNYNVGPDFFEIIIYGIMAAGLIMLVMKLLGVEFRSVIPYGRNKVSTLEYEIGEENIDEMDFPSLIEQAKIDQQHVLVVRYYYLYTLKLLSEGELIKYELRKTNTEYIQEINASDVRNQFTTIARTFEKVWYGRIEATSDTSQDIGVQFKQVRGAL